MTTAIEPKSNLRKWIEKIVGDMPGMGGVEKSHVKEAGLLVRGVGEGAVVGSVLGAIDAEIGLDPKGAPLDLIGTAIAGAGAVWFAKEEIATDLRNTASSCITVFSFRKTKELLQRKSSVGVEETSVGADQSSDDVGEEDPVVQAAREL